MAAQKRKAPTAEWDEEVEEVPMPPPLKTQRTGVDRKKGRWRKDTVQRRLGVVLLAFSH